MNIVIKKANKDVCKKLAYIKKEVWNSTYRGIYSDEKLENFNYLEHELKFRDNLEGLYIICDDDKLVGYFSFGYPKYNYKDYNYCLNSLYIIDSHKRKGIGTLVFDFINKYCENNNIDAYFTNCNKYNESALKFYIKMGGVISKLDDTGIDKGSHQYYIEFKKN